jgi:hypothetical protein
MCPTKEKEKKIMNALNLPSIEKHEEFKDIVDKAHDVGENTCPLCKKGYPETINYCITDGTRLQEPADRPSSKARMGRDADSGSRMVSGHAEEG